MNLIDTVIEDKYKFIKLLGSSVVFNTYLAVDIGLNKNCIIEVYDRTHSRFESVIRNQILLETSMINLNHPTILKVVDVVENEQCSCIVREYIVGDTLDVILKNNKQLLTVENVIIYAIQIAEGLHYIHTQNPPIVHNNIEPKNIILTSDGKIKIVNLRYPLVHDLDYISSILFAPGYTAPEGFVRGKADARTDIYSLGVTLHQLLTGVDPTKPPYECIPICHINPFHPKGLEYIIEKCVKPDPNERYQNCDELLDDLRNYKNLPSLRVFGSKIFKRKGF